MAGAEVVVVAVEVAVIKQTYCPPYLKVQWHITNKCNLRCAHCYQDDFTVRGFDQSGLLHIANHVFNWWEGLSSNKPLHFVLTGGEPCTHPHFKELLLFLASHPNNPRIDILSNGTLLNEEWIIFFKKVKIRSIQLSIDGIEETHDGIRGKGNFQKVLAASKLLKDTDIRVVWSFTAHQKNYLEFDKIAALAKKYKIHHVWTDRMIPECAQESVPAALDQEMTTDYLKMLQKSSQRHGKHVGLTRALQFQASGGRSYSCQAGNGLITIMPNGDLYPCRRLPTNVGNILQTPLSELYDCQIFRELRDFEYPKQCEGCTFKHSCKGGLRCLSHVINNDMFSKDPGCSILSQS